MRVVPKDTSLDRSEIRCLWNDGDRGSDRVQINIGHTLEQCTQIQQGLRSESSLPKAPGAIVLCVGFPCQRLINATHEPTHAVQALTPNLKEAAVIRFLVDSEEATPSLEHFLIRPTLSALVGDPNDDVVMVVHDCVRQQIDREDRGQLTEAIFYPLPSM